MIRGIVNRYFEWIYDLAFPSKIDRLNYGRLLNALNDIPFRYIIPLDENRMRDGVDLRYRFCYSQGLNNDIIEDVLNSNGCSMLEMMIALALRCDEHIMYDSAFGGRANVWFFEMIKNLGLDIYTNDNFDSNGFIFIMNRLLNREYEPDGTGGLFIIRNRPEDIRQIEIWYQLNWYLNENFK